MDYALAYNLNRMMRLGVGGLGSDLRRAILVIIGGQSNSGTDPNTGRQDYADFPTYLQAANNNVEAWDIAIENDLQFSAYVPEPGRQMGWIDQMLNVLAARYQNVRFVKRAAGGSTLGSSGAEYPRSDFKNRANGAIAAMDAEFGAGNYDVVVLWNQGESDALSSTLANAYETNLSEWFAEIRANVIADVPIIYNKLSDYQAEDFPFISTVQAAQEAVALESTNNYLLDGSKIQVDEDADDYSHYSPQGFIQLGTLFWQEVRDLFGLNDPQPVPAVVSAIVPEAANDTIEITFSRNLAPVLPYWDDIGTSTGRQVIWASISGTVLTLTMSEPYWSGVTETLSYTRGSDWFNYLQGQDANEVANFSGQAVTNNSVEAAPTATIVHQPDWSTGTDGWFGGSGGVMTGGESVGGRTGVAKMTWDGADSSTVFLAPSGISSGGPRYKISFDIFVQQASFIASNTGLIRSENGVSSGIFDVWALGYFPRYWREGEWIHVERTVEATSSRPRFQFLSHQGPVYVDNFVVEKLA